MHYYLQNIDSQVIFYRTELLFYRVRKSIVCLTFTDLLAVEPQLCLPTPVCNCIIIIIMIVQTKDGLRWGEMSASVWVDLSCRLPVQATTSGLPSHSCAIAEDVEVLASWPMWATMCITNINYHMKKFPTLYRRKSQPFPLHPDGTTLCWWTRAHSERRCPTTTCVLSPLLILLDNQVLPLVSGSNVWPGAESSSCIKDRQSLTGHLINNRQIQYNAEPPWNIFLERFTAE